MRIITIITICFALTVSLNAQKTFTLTLQDAIDIAADSSLESFRTKNMYMASYWQYRTYKAERLPSLDFNSNPFNYNRDITKQYNINTGAYEYLRQQNLNMYGSLSIQQNLDLTGGTFFLNTELARLENFGKGLPSSLRTQFTSVPLKIGYVQTLFGFNSFKWERKIEPLKFENAKKVFLYNVEQISESTTDYFFSLALSQTLHQMAQQQLLSSDTLYAIGCQRQELLSISQSDLLTLQLDVVNAQNTLSAAELELKKDRNMLASYLGFKENSTISVSLPEIMPNHTINVAKALEYANAYNPIFSQLTVKQLEAEQHLDKTKKESRFKAEFSASVGLNQYDRYFSNVYHNPMRQDYANINLSIPIVDWGVRKGKVNMAKMNLNTTYISNEQDKLRFTQEVITTVDEYNRQQKLINGANQALKLATLAYAQTRERFLIGKADINSLTLAVGRKNEAQKNYIYSLRNYWMCYYRLRKLTMYDFEKSCPISFNFDLLYGVVK